MVENIISVLFDGTRYPGILSLIGSIVLAMMVLSEIVLHHLKKRPFCENWHPVWMPVATVTVFACLIGLDHARVSWAS